MGKRLLGGLAAGVLIGAFAAAAAGYQIKVKPLEERLEAFQIANEIAELHARAYTISEAAEDFCSLNISSFSTPAKETRGFVEGLSYEYRRNYFPVADTLVWLDELKRENIRFVASDDLPNHVAAQFFNSAEGDKTLVFSSSILFGSDLDKMFDFYRQAKEARFAAPGQVMALINQSPIPGDDKFSVVSGPVGMSEIVVEKGGYRLPVSVAPKPC